MGRIFTNRKSGFIQRGGRMRRESRWLDVPTVEATLAGAPTAVITNSLTAIELALRPFTVVRSRLSLLVNSDQSAATETYGAAIGMAVVSDQAAAIGVTAVPTPITDQASDLWFLYELAFGRLQFKDATGIVEVGQLQLIDSRAMRKVEDGQDLVIVVENTIAGAVTTSGGRVLIKLH